MALTAEQTKALAENEDFLLRLMQQGAILGHAAQATDVSGETEEYQLRWLKRALRFERGNGVAEAFMARIIKSVIGSAAVQAATEPDASDVTDSDLKDALETVILAVNRYEDLSNTEIL